MPIEGQAPDPFEAFESAAAVVAFLFKQFGADGIRELFALPGMEARSVILPIAGELKQMRLGKLSRLLLQIAKTKPERDDRCPYPADSVDARIWAEDRQRLGKQVKKPNLSETQHS